MAMVKLEMRQVMAILQLGIVSEEYDRFATQLNWELPFNHCPKLPIRSIDQVLIMKSSLLQSTK